MNRGDFVKLFAYILCLFFCFPMLIQADDSYFYLALGDSITKGYGIDDIEDTYTVQVKNHLEELLGVSVQLDNQAINGITSQTFYEHIQKEVILEKIKKADFITISIGSNDFLNELIHDIPSYYFGTTNLENFQKISDHLYDYMEKIYDVIESVNPNVIVVILPLYNPYKSLLSSKVNEAFLDLQNRYIEQIQKRNFSIYVLDTLTSKLEVSDYLNLDIGSGNLDPHPNVEGNRLIAQSVNQVLDRIYSKSDNVFSIVSIVFVLGFFIFISFYFLIRKYQKKLVS